MHTEPSAEPSAPSAGNDTPRKWGRLRFVALLIVIAIGTAYFAVNAIASLNAASANPTPDPAGVTSVELRYMGRIAVGITGMAGDQEVLRKAGGLGQIRGQIDAIADNPIDLIRGAIVLAEAGDIEAAQEMLDEADTAVDAYAAALDGDATPEQRRTLGQRTTERLASKGAGAREWIDAARRDIAAVRAVLDAGSAETLSSQAADRLVQRHRFFGELISTYGAGDDSKQRRAIVERAVATTLGVAGMAVVGLLAVLAGFVLFIVAVVLLARGTIRPRLNWKPRMPAAERSLLLETVVVFMVGFAGLQLAAAPLSNAAGRDLTLALMWLLAPIVVWPLLRGMPRRGFVIAMGWHANGRGVTGLFKEIASGVAGYLAGLPVAIAGFLLALLLLGISGTETNHPITGRALDTSALGIALLYSMTTLWAPLVEESVFRGAMYFGLRRTLGVAGAALINAFVFALIHPQGWMLAPALGGLAVVFSLLREWRGSLVPSITAHALHNAFITTLLILILG